MPNNAYPLHWPPGWARTKSPGSSQFKTSLSGALKNVEKSIALFAKDSGKKISDVVISSNVTLGNLRPEDSGVAAYFEWDGINTCIAVDRYAKVEENLQAIHHCIEAERTKLRHGGLNLVRAAFRGYAGLPPPNSETGAKRKWWEVLGCNEDSAQATVNGRYRQLRSAHHPDKGGSSEKFHEVQQAYDEYKETRS